MFTREAKGIGDSRTLKCFCPVSNFVFYPWKPSQVSKLLQLKANFIKK